MDIEKLIAGLKEKGMNDDEVKVELEKIKKDIEVYLSPAEEPKEKKAEVEHEVETDEAKEKRVFGI